jgi:hypothetical protein
MVIAWESIVGKLPQLKLKYAQEIWNQLGMKVCSLSFEDFTRKTINQRSVCGWEKDCLKCSVCRVIRSFFSWFLRKKISMALWGLLNAWKLHLIMWKISFSCCFSYQIKIQKLENPQKLPRTFKIRTFSTIKFLKFPSVPPNHHQRFNQIRSHESAFFHSTSSRGSNCLLCSTKWNFHRLTSQEIDSFDIVLSSNPIHRQQ